MRWDDAIPMIMRGDKVEGGRAAKPNLQAGVLANRTQYLRSELENIRELYRRVSNHIPARKMRSRRSIME